MITVSILPQRATSQTVRDSVRMELKMHQYAGLGSSGACGAGIFAIWPNVLTDILGREGRYGDYGRVATDGMWVPFGYGEQTSTPDTGIEVPAGYLGHNPQLGGGALGDNPEACADAASAVMARLAGAWGPLNARAFRITEWYATFSVPSGTPIALFLWEQGDGLRIDFDGSFASGQSREIDAAAVSGKRPVASYEWNFGDGATGTGAMPAHTYEEAGEYDVTLTVIDDDGETDSITRTIKVVAGRLTVWVRTETPVATDGEEIVVIGTVENTGSEEVVDIVAERLFTYIALLPEELHVEGSQFKGLDLEPVELQPGESESVELASLAPGDSFVVQRNYVVTKSATYRLKLSDAFVPGPVEVTWQSVPVKAQTNDGDAAEVSAACQKAECDNLTVVKPLVPELTFELTVERYPDGEKPADGEILETVVGDSVMVRIGIENTGGYPMENIAIVGGGEGIAVAPDSVQPLKLLRIDHEQIARLEPEQSDTLAFLYEVTAPEPSITVSIVGVQAVAVHPVTDARTSYTADAVCEPAGKAHTSNPGCGKITASGPVVNSTGDAPLRAGAERSCDTGGERVTMRDGTTQPECTLRAAIQLANAGSGEAAGPATIEFDIPNTPSIQVEDPLVIEAPVVIDGTSQFGYQEGQTAVEVRGGSSDGFVISAENVEIRGLAILLFPGAAVRVHDAGAVVENNFFGTDRSGLLNATNGVGILIENAAGVIVRKNIIAGSEAEGIKVEGSGADKIVIEENLIGVDVQGKKPMSNGKGISVSAAPGISIRQNVVSASASVGIEVTGVEAVAATIEDNKIGVDMDGGMVLGNDIGISIVSAPGANIRKNLISGNRTDGIRITGRDAAGATIEDNLIGVDAEGETDLGNGNGIHIVEAPENVIRNNQIAGNDFVDGKDGSSGVGIFIGGSSSTGNRIEGNIFGADKDVETVIANNSDVHINNAPNNSVGGNPDTRNYFSGKLVITGIGATGNTIQSNYFGTRADGTRVLDGLKETHSVILVRDASDTIIGGREEEAGNVTTSGIYVEATRARIEGNFIGIQPDGVSRIEGSLCHYSGIMLHEGDNDDFDAPTEREVRENLVAHCRADGISVFRGRFDVIESNTIFSNGGSGISRSWGSPVTIRANSIYNNGGIGIDMADRGVTLNAIFELDNIFGISRQNFPHFLYAPHIRADGSLFGLGEIYGAHEEGYVVDVYHSDVCNGDVNGGPDPAAPFGEGRYHLGSVLAHPMGVFNIADAEFTFILLNAESVVDVGDFITATATDPEGNTSEFSRCFPVMESPLRTKAQDVDPAMNELAMDDFGIAIDIQRPTGKSSTAEGIMYVTRYETAPGANVFADASATSAGGSEIEPSQVVPDYWHVADRGLSAHGGRPESPYTFDVCLNPAGLITGASMDEAVIVQRGDSTHWVWTPRSTHIEERSGAQHLCTNGLDALGEFTIATRSANGSVLAGDASDDDALDAADAALILRHSVGEVALVGRGLAAADVSGDGDANALDASLVLRRSVDVIPCFPVESDCAVPVPGADARLEWGVARRTGSIDGTIWHEIPLMLSDGKDEVYAVDVDLDLQHGITLHGWMPTMPDDWITAQHLTIDSTSGLRVAAAGRTPLKEGTIATLHFADADTSMLDLRARVRINGSDWWELNGITATSNFDVETPPANFALDPNYPNPFNPRTVIGFALAEIVDVRLAVFDILGREVALLIDGVLPAGRHEAVFEAGVLPSGAYIYHLQAGTFRQTRRMLLVK